MLICAPQTDDDNDDETIVMVGGKSVAFEDITDEHIVSTMKNLSSVL